MRYLPLAFALVLAACNDDGDTDTDVPDTGDTDTGDTDDTDDTDVPGDAFVRVIHLAPNVGVVDAFVNDGTDPAFPDADFLDGTAYAPLPAGSYDFDVSLDGEPATNPALSLSATLEEGVSYAAVAHGYAGGDPAAALTPFVENSSDVPANTTRIHIVHAAADVGEVDVYNAADTSSALVENLAYGADADDIDIPPTALVVGIDVDDDPSSLEFTFDVPDLGNQYVSVYAVNRQETDGGPLDLALVAHLEDGSTAVLEPVSNTVLDQTFDDAGSISSWEGLADGAGAEASLTWADGEGNPGGALEVSGVNTSTAGRAYIFRTLDTELDYGAGGDFTVSFDLKSEGALVGTAVQLGLEFPGVAFSERLNLQNEGLNDATWTTYSYDIEGISGDPGTTIIQLNLAAGAFEGAGGTLLIDNVVIAPSE